MNERERVIRIWQELFLDPTQCVINGSGSMVLQEVPRPRPMGDLDIFCTTRLWFQVLGRHDGWRLDTPDPSNWSVCCAAPVLRRDMHGLRVDMYFDNFSPSGKLGTFQPALCMRNAVRVQGIPCVPLPLVLAWKREVGRQKDLDDVHILEQLLGESA